MTKKQRGFVNDYVIDENGTKAALNNYDIEGKNREGIASVIATQNLGKLNVVEAIETKRISLREALINQGINEKKIAEKIDVLLNATDGEKTDYTAVDKGLKHATAIYGITPEGPTSQTNVTYNFLFSPETQNRIKAINEEIKSKLINNEPIK